MFIALNDKKEYIRATDANKTQRFICPGCREKVVLKNGDIKQKHFAHFKQSACATFSENETPQHLAGKLQLAIYLQQYGDVKIEAVIPEISQRPDLLMQRGKRQIAVEYQCSPISKQRLEERNNGYLSQNIKVIWILGDNYLAKKMTQGTILKFLANNELVFYTLSTEKFIHRSSFTKCDFESVRYIESTNSNLFETGKTIGKPKIDVEKQVYKLQNLILQSRVDEKLVNYLYKNNRVLLHAPIWIHKGCQFGLMIPNWQWRLLVILLLERIGTGHVVHQDILICKLSPYVIGEARFKKQQLLIMLEELEQSQFILQREQYILVKKLPAWYESVQQKLYKVRE